MRKVLLDTNAYTNYLLGDETILRALSQTDIVYMSVFVIAELYFGFKGGSKELKNKELLKQFLNKPSVEIIDATVDTSDIFADIKYKLKKAGTPIPLNDVWIGAHAIETGAVLITYDQHFDKIAGLRLWDYVK
jgi:tRNA(fMet)-specific endonuclease VapC